MTNDNHEYNQVIQELVVFAFVKTVCCKAELIFIIDSMENNNGQTQIFVGKSERNDNTN